MSHNPYRDRLVRFYTKWEPSKLSNVDTALATFQGREEKMFATLVKKYGPEPEGPPGEAPTQPSSPARSAPAAATVAPPAPAADADNPYRQRLIRFYTKWEPAKLANVETALTTFKGREEKMFATLVKKYGPEPGGDADGPATAVRSGGDISVSQASPVTGSGSPAAATSSTGGNPYKERLVRMLTKYTPDKVGQADAMLTKFAGREEALFKSLTQRLGPEPDSPTSPAPAPSGGGGGDTHKARLIRMLEKYAPEKVSQADAMLAKYKGREEDMFSSLVKRLGPEPPAPASTNVSPAPAPNGGGGAQKTPEQKTRERLVRMIQHYTPDKMNSVDAMLTKYKGREEQMFQALTKRLGPEPPAPTEGTGAPPAPAPPAPTAGQQQEQQQPASSPQAPPPQQFTYSGFLHSKIGSNGVEKLNKVFSHYLEGHKEAARATEFVACVGVCAECCDLSAEDPFQRFPNPPTDFDHFALAFYQNVVELINRESQELEESIYYEELACRQLIWKWVAEDKARIEQLIQDRIRHRSRVATKAIEIIDQLEEKLRKEIEDAYRLEFLGRMKWFKDQRDKILLYYPPSHMGQIEERFTKWKDLVRRNQDEMEGWASEKKRIAAAAAANDNRIMSARGERQKSPGSGSRTARTIRTNTGVLTVARQKELEIEMTSSGPRRSVANVPAHEKSFRKSFAKIQGEMKAKQTNQHIEALKQEYQDDFGLSDEDALAAAELAYNEFYYQELSPRNKQRLFESRPTDQKIWNQNKPKGPNLSRARVNDESVRLPMKHPLPSTKVAPFRAALPGGNNADNLTRSAASGRMSPGAHNSQSPRRVQLSARAATPNSGGSRRYQEAAAPSPQQVYNNNSSSSGGQVVSPQSIYRTPLGTTGSSARMWNGGDDGTTTTTGVEMSPAMAYQQQYQEPYSPPSGLGYNNNEGYGQAVSPTGYRFS